ncbi:MAG: hypothetical protein IPO81_09590 [Kouleothrix sp.]|nr:hypothetical protein [Kouleothrix sp.]
MAAFNYTTVDALKKYVDTLGTADDELLADVVTGVSRAVDRWCGQAFVLATYTDQVLTAQIDVDGVLTCWPAVPTMGVPSAASYRVRPAQTWIALDVANLDVEAAPSGCVVRCLSPNIAGYRGRALQMRLSYIGGYASRDALPSDFVWAVRQACAAEYKAREAAGGADVSTAPDGSVITPPQDWPRRVTRALGRYVRHIPA